MLFRFVRVSEENGGGVCRVRIVSMSANQWLKILSFG